MQMQKNSDQAKILEVVYPLDDYFNKSGQINSHLQIAVQKIRQAFKHQFTKIIKELDIELIQTKAYFAKHSKGNFKQKSGILFRINAAIKSLPKMFFNIQKFFYQKSITFFSLDTVVNNSNYQQVRLKLQEENMDLVSIDSMTIGVINYSSHKNSITHIKSLLTTTKHLISIADFDLPQIKVLIEDQKQIWLSLMRKGLSYKYQIIDEDSFYIICDHKNYYDFVHFAKKYLEQNKKEQSLVQQFKSEFQISVFITYYAEELKNQFPTLVFYQKQGKLYRNNKVVEQDQIYECIKLKKKEMDKKIIKIPSIYKISGKKVQTIKNTIFCKQYLIKTKKYTFTTKKDTKIDLFIKSLHSLSNLQQNVVFLINDKACCRSFKKLLEENQYKPNNYLNESNSKKYKGIHEFQLQKSRFFSSILMCSIQRGNRNQIDQLKLSRNVTEIIQKFKNQRQLNLVFSSDFDCQLTQIFMQILKELIRNEGWDRLKKITILLQEQDQVQYKKTFRMISKMFENQKIQQKLKIASQSGFYLSKSQLQKIFFLEFYQIKYSEMKNAQLQTLSLSNVNSFLMNIAINNNKGSKSQINIPVCLVQKDDYKYQYVVNIKNETYHKLDKYCNVTEGFLAQNQQLQKIIRTIKKFFQNIIYFVIYEGKQKKLIRDKFYFYACNQDSDKKDKRLKKMVLSQDFSKIAIKKKQVIFTVVSKNHLKSYEIHTYKQFQTEIKRQIIRGKKDQN